VRSAGRICAASKTNRQDECRIRTTSRLQTTQCRDSGLAMGWAGWTKSRGPGVGASEFFPYCMGVLCTWVKLLTNSAHRIAQKCVWRPRSARTRWGAIALPRPFLYFVSCRRYTFIPRYTTIIGRISRCKIKSSVTSRAAECPCPSSHLTVDIDRSADNKRHKSPASRRSEERGSRRHC